MNPKPKILVVEDDPEVRDVICSYLLQHGMEVVIDTTGADVMSKLGDVQLLLLDLQLPQADGLEILREVRKRGHLPVLIVSARADGVDRVTGLELGADDYLAKPFLPRELVARVKSLLRRAMLPPITSLQSGPVVLDSEARSVSVDGQPLNLTPREYAIFKTLFQAPGKTFSREEILDRIWGEEYLGQTRRVDLLVSKVRAKLAEFKRDELIHSVWGVGYRFEV